MGIAKGTGSDSFKQMAAKVGPLPSGLLASSGPPSVLVPTVATPCTPRDLLLALRAVLGLSFESCMVLVTHWAIETATGSRCFNWNVGNKKKVKGRPYMMLRGTWEILASVPAGAASATKRPDGLYRVTFQPPHPQTHFMSFDSLGEGTEYYANGLRTKYHRCWPHVLTPSPDGFARALKSHGYYTAPVESYAKMMTSRYGQLFKAVLPDVAITALGITDVREFQRAHGLEADGVIGPKTRAVMLRELNEAWTT